MIFVDNKYTKAYFNIINNAKARVLSPNTYSENHHIVPESFYKNRIRPGPKGWLDGDPNSNDNMVNLTAREHFICHWLLIKMTEGRAYAITVYALNGLQRNGKDNKRYETKITGRVYARLKEEFSKVHSEYMKGKDPWNKGKPASEETIKHLRTIARNRKPPTLETIEKRAAKQRGQKRSQETRDKISEALKGKLKGPMSNEEKLKRSITMKGKPKPEGFGLHMVEVMRQKFTENNPNKREDLKKVCPHCLGKFGPSNYARWHGDNCKHKR